MLRRKKQVSQNDPRTHVHCFTGEPGNPSFGDAAQSPSGSGTLRQRECRHTQATVDLDEARTHDIDQRKIAKEFAHLVAQAIKDL